MSRFETHCAETKADISFDTVTALYEDPTSLEVVQDPYLRMQARAYIAAAEAEKQAACFQACTAEAQKLSSQFADGEFISKLIPDPIEQGVQQAIQKIVMPLTRLLGGGK